ncbi:Alpha-galactosidase [Symbiodinium microadriaticum]|uniref:Alpha-galactosidase n=1 Tax=Symbiodinium microadriaticum TaxID=2951 RepID=A0A1Q9CIW6_SYMMI|nr:Alpha-galactosidase [Symbiodinium microadriaticum]
MLRGVTADVRDWKGVYEAARVMEKLSSYHGPHGWNDPDMLIGSSQGAKLLLTPAQSRAQFSLWAVMSAPLMLGANVLKLTDFDLEPRSTVKRKPGIGRHGPQHYAILLRFTQKTRRCRIQSDQSPRLPTLD